MKRKIVQIAVCEQSYNGLSHGVVFALANDGSLWRGYRTNVGEDFKWYSLPELPDDNSNLNKVR